MIEIHYTKKHFYQDLLHAKTLFKKNWFHTILSSLGILIGVASVIIIISIGESAKKISLDNFNKMGLNTIRVHHSNNAKQINNLSKGLSYKDYTVIKNIISYQGLIAPAYIDKEIEILHKNKNFKSTIIGTNTEFSLVEELLILEGRSFIKTDINAKLRHILVNSKLSKRYQISLADTLLVSGDIYKVIGIFESKIEGENLLLLPYTSYPFTKASFDQINISIKEKSLIYKKANIIDKNLQRLHHGVKDYSLVIPLKLLEKQEKTKQLFSIVVLSIAFISLLTGGMSIMNIMLSKIGEQTREIGLRFALGATKNRIIIQYLIQTSFITIISGIVGTVLGYFVLILLNVFSDLSIVFSFKALFLAFSMTFFSGVIFGMYPAKRASEIEPMKALRDV